MAMGHVLNQQLTSALGRPDLAFSTSPTATGTTPVIGTSPGAGLQLDTPSRGPGLALIVTVALLGGFIWWVHPHLL